MTDTAVTSVASFANRTDLDRLAASLEALALKFSNEASQSRKRRRRGSPKRPLPELPRSLGSGSPSPASLERKESADRILPRSAA
jgi:hypothetical protein